MAERQICGMRFRQDSDHFRLPIYWSAIESKDGARCSIMLAQRDDDKWDAVMCGLYDELPYIGLGTTAEEAVVDLLAVTRKELTGVMRVLQLTKWTDDD